MKRFTRRDDKNEYVKNTNECFERFIDISGRDTVKQNYQKDITLDCANGIGGIWI